MQVRPVPDPFSASSQTVESSVAIVEDEDLVSWEVDAVCSSESDVERLVGRNQESSSGVFELIRDLSVNVAGIGTRKDPASHDGSHEDDRKEDSVARVEK